MEGAVYISVIFEYFVIYCCNKWSRFSYYLLPLPRLHPVSWYPDPDIQIMITDPGNDLPNSSTIFVVLIALKLR